MMKATTIGFSTSLLLIFLQIACASMRENPARIQQKEENPPLKSNVQTDPNASPYADVIDEPSLPRILLIGDSISEGYTIPVRKLLAGKANVHHIPVNGQDTGFALQHIREWLGNGPWAVIHFNWGIWDAHHLGPGGEI